MTLVASATILQEYILGEFGVVYKATLNGWQGNHERTVAVKTLKGKHIEISTNFKGNPLVNKRWVKV